LVEASGEIVDLISTAERAALKRGWPMATTKRVLEREPSDVELLLPWHAAGALNAGDARRVEDALARDPKLAGQYAVIREEYAATIDLNENLAAPSMRAMQKLFAAIDAEPARRSDARLGLTARLTPRFLRQRLG
jgi:anti-sigma factor RsiW